MRTPLDTPNRKHFPTDAKNRGGGEMYEPLGVSRPVFELKQTCPDLSK